MQIFFSSYNFEIILFINIFCFFKIMLSNIQKRTGQIVPFDQSLITTAIKKSVESTLDHGISLDNFAENITNEISQEIDHQFFQHHKTPNIEDIQNIVEEKLVESGNITVAKNYILYRAERAKLRAEQRILDLEKLDKNLLKVTKFSGEKQNFSKNKLKKLWQRVSFDFSEICPFPEVFEIFKITLVDGISTTQILQNLRKATLDKISIENIHWQVIAGRLCALEFYKLATRNRKMSYQDIYTQKSWLKHFLNYLKKNLYYSKFLNYYTEDEIYQAGSWINKERDFTYIYSTQLAFSKRYLLNPNKIFHELPQEMYLAIALFLAIPEDKTQRLTMARRIYESTSTQKLSLPTPTLLNARTNFHQLSSCFKLNVDDDLRSIYHNIENMAQISKFGGGVGVYLGHIRAKGAAIRNVNNASGGVIPWVRVINDTACAVNQLGARLGAISPTLDVWHLDIYDFLEIQTETGDIRSKAFDVFPSISVPDIFMKRVETNMKWTLFDPHEIFQITGKKLENYFDKDFTSFYEECEKNEKILKKEQTFAKDLMKTFLKTAVETGLPYVFFRDTVNRVNPNKHAGNIYSTQLCTEICQNTKEAKFVSETAVDGNIQIQYEKGETVVCNLASINIAKVHTELEMKEVIDVGMHVLDNVITLNFYPIIEAELTAKKYRSVGLGFMGLAEYLACNKLAYDKIEARNHVDILFEKYAFFALESSNKLAQKRGAYELFTGSEWSKGLVFNKDINWFSKNTKTKKDWNKLINKIKEHGLRFAYNFAPAPNTSTAGVVGTTAGLLPIYKKFFVETNVIAPTVTVAPNLTQENFWFYKEYHAIDMQDVIKMMSVIYKWIDQSISFEWMIDPAETSPEQLYGYYIQAWKAEIKTIYYLRSFSGVLKDDCVSCSG